MGFIKFILILVIIYYSLKLIGRFVFPWLLGRLIKKLQKQQGFYHFGPGQQQPTPEPEGKVTVQYQKKEKTKHATEGEYVDFEEVR